MDDVDFSSIFQDIKWPNSKLNTYVSENRMSSKKRENGTYYAGVVFDSLKNRGQFKVARVRLVGSVGKGTALRDSDFDLVAFVNDEYPPFTRVLRSFRSILETSDIPNLKNLEHTRNSVQFEINGYSFDLLAATNFEATKKSQFNAAFDFMARLKKPEKHGYNYSSAFGESAVEFVKSEPQFVKDVIILAKAWIDNIQDLGYISGKSYLIELVAIYVNEGKRNKYILTGFVRFLKKMADFPNIYVSFKSNYHESWIPRHMEDGRALVLDPTNPWNNLADGVSYDGEKILSEAALEMLSRLADFGYDDYTDVDDLFDTINVQ